MPDRSSQPDPSALAAQLDLTTPLIGLYDAPRPDDFAPVVTPGKTAKRGPCVFAFYRRWLKGETLHLSPESFGCGGAGRALCGVQTRERDDFIDFLWRDEGLRASRELMAGWVDNAPTYHMTHGHVLIGPLKPEHYRYLQTVTFWVNPDQLAVLQVASYLHHAWGDPDPVTAPFGSGCSELVSVFRDLDVAQAAIGSTDVAMREHLPPDLLAFTVTVPLFERLCALTAENSFLGKGFLTRLRKARGGSLTDSPPADASR